MEKNMKRGSILIYSLVLVTLSLMMAAVVLKSATTLSLNYTFVNTKNKLARIIRDDSRIIFKLAKKLNSDGTGFVDNLRCPQNVSMSGSVNSQTISTTLYANESSLYCLGAYQGQPLKIYFNEAITDLHVADYNGSLVVLTDSGVGRRGATSFTDGEATLIDFSAYNHRVADGIDDDVNSDNYRESSTDLGAYPYNYEDNDALHRKVKFGYVAPGAGYNSIFWNNEKTARQIDNNSNNIEIVNQKMSGVTSAYMYLNIDKKYSIFLYKFDKSVFSESSELKIIEKLTGANLDAGVGYLQNNSGVLSLSPTKTTNEYEFNFRDYDYSILVENITAEVLSYSVRASDSVSGAGIYIVPLDDSDPVLLKYLGNTIILDEEGMLISEQGEIVSSK